MQYMKRRYNAILIIVLLLISGCEKVPPEMPPAAESPNVTPVLANASDMPATPTPFAAFPPSAVLTPSPVPAPSLNVAKIGAIGDILMMTSQIEAARTQTGYDFTRSFMPVCSLFSGADIVCANLEVPLAGESKGYTKPRATAPPATLENPSPTAPYQTFNAPDELAQALKFCGIDLITTANNHALDRGADGLYRTINILRAAGLSQTGTFLSEAGRDTPCILDVNGIKIGFIACTSSVNRRDGKLTKSEKAYAVARLDEAYIKADIANAKAAGAEFIIVFPHKGTEYETQPNSSQKKLYRKLAEFGADAVFASHPHVVQPIDWVSVTRESGSVDDVPIVYSLGNFISNQSPSPRDYGLYVELTIEKPEGGDVIIKELAYLPLYCVRQKTETGEIMHQTLPCYCDTSKIVSLNPLNTSELAGLNKAREHIIKLIGLEKAVLME